VYALYINFVFINNESVLLPFTLAYRPIAGKATNNIAHSWGKKTGNIISVKKKLIPRNTICVNYSKLEWKSAPKSESVGQVTLVHGQFFMETPCFVVRKQLPTTQVVGMLLRKH
jgi:hypothetical protein